MENNKKPTVADLTLSLIAARGTTISVERWYRFIDYCINRPDETKIAIKKAYDKVCVF